MFCVGILALEPPAFALKIQKKYRKKNRKKRKEEKKERHKDETSTNNHLQKTMGEVILGNLTPLAKSIKH